MQLKMRNVLTTVLPVLFGSLLVFGLPTSAEAQEVAVMKEEKSNIDELATAPPVGGDYQPVSELTGLPEFVPGLGKLYVEPEDMPHGPYFAYDRDNQLVSTVYMIPTDDLKAQKNFEDLTVAVTKIRRVDLKFNPGHAGLEKPHYHLITWYVPNEQVKQLAMSSDK